MKKQILNNILDKTGADAILLYSPQNRFWFSRFNSSLGYLLYTKKESLLFLDGRYITAARESKGLINIDKTFEFKKIYDQLNSEIEKKEIKKLLFESDWIFYNQANNFINNLNTTVEGYNFDCVRMIKDQWEIEQIRKACDITHEVFLEVLSYVKPGMSEIQLSNFVTNAFLEKGAHKLSFDTIVASGKNGSKPHAVPSDKIINENDFVTLDMGCVYNGYCSDQTRTFAMGSDNDSTLKEIYQVVYEAQELGITNIKPGVKTSDIHKICYEYIDSKGFGEYFTHGTGHGLGIEIHEEPYNSITGDKFLEEGMCVTVEPGIYIPGTGGVRIEDDILVTSTGYDYLTTPLRKLQIVK
ncbi:aminopeptidase P family protein [Spiroplasma turonicum]|uniref:Xaa-Pro dipeptidase n=1 Tax=Spiroplasma turonicum TaxID=216946 RepID=A0A0K1P6M2_9MOLU|nr:aminopeptidase P family protein [Spiroplasma turonicum]AKU79507.1 Xaa-Pro dipeptidase [Spiroplasma turonicum]ALX70530.1 Xaa-Pro dipeptidase [Spiroplasma turonicum]